MNPLFHGHRYKEIIKALEKLKLRHAEHIAAYGEGNERRLTVRWMCVWIVGVRIMKELSASLYPQRTENAPKR